MYRGIWESIDLARENRLGFMAASIAFYAFVSVFPLMMLVLAVGSLVGSEALTQRILLVVSDVLSPGGQTQVREAILGVQGRSGATIIGFAGLTWSGLRVFRGLDLAFGSIYGTGETENLFRQLSDAIVGLTALMAGVAAIVVGNLLLLWVGFPLAVIPDTIGMSIALTVVFLGLYTVFPDVPISLREALPGALAAGIGWTALSSLFRLYIRYAGQFDAYGVVGGALIFVTWLYFGAQIVLFGALVNAVLKKPDRQVQAGPQRNFFQSQTMNGTDGSEGEDDTGAETSNGHVDSPGRDADAEESPTAESGTPRASQKDLTRLREDLDRLEREMDDRTVHSETVKRDLRKYVRSRVRRGHAQGWGPYLVLLYGTAMTLGGFYLLSGIWAVLAMVVIWLSTLGLYVLMIIVGISFSVLGLTGRVTERLRNVRN